MVVLIPPVPLMASITCSALCIVLLAMLIMLKSVNPSGGDGRFLCDQLRGDAALAGQL